MMSISELAKDNPTALEPKRVMFVVGNKDDMKKTIN